MSVTIRPTLTFEHVSGPALDAEWLLDILAAQHARQNGSATPLVVSLERWEDADPDPVESVYELSLVE